MSFILFPIGTCPVSGHHREDLGSLCIPSHQVFTHTDKIPLSLLFSRLPQLSLPLFACQVFHSLNHPCGPSLDPLQYAHVSLMLGSPVLDAGMVSLGLSKQEGSPVGNTQVHATQDAVGLVCCKGTLQPHVRLGVYQDPTVLL